jgi:cell division protein FtsA
MNPKNILVGLDIGTTKICCIVAQKVDGRKIEILGSGVVPSRGVQDGEVKNIRDTAEDIQSAVAIAQTKTGVTIQKVFVGIAGAHVRSSVYKLGYTRQNSSKLIDIEDIKVLEDQVKNLNNEPGEEIISYQPQEFYIDQKVPIKNNPIGVMGNRLEASWHVITGNVTSTKSIEMSVQMAGLELLDFDLEPLASAASVLTQEQMEEGVCLIDIGGGTTDIAIFTKGIIRHTAIFPYAGEYITQMIQSKMKLKYDTARKLKEMPHVTSAMYQHIPETKMFTVSNLVGLPPVNIQQRYYCRLVQACLEQIFNQVKNEIASSYYKDKLNAGIVVTGGGAMIPHLKNFVEQYTGMHTIIGQPLSRLSNLQDKNYAHPSFATSIGLALLASDNDHEIIVENKEFESQKDTKEAPVDHTTQFQDEAPIQEQNKSWLQKIQGKIGNFLLDEQTLKDFEDR